MQQFIINISTPSQINVKRDMTRKSTSGKHQKNQIEKEENIPVLVTSNCEKFPKYKSLKFNDKTRVNDKY